jgi:hypothetical protein
MATEWQPNGDHGSSSRDPHTLMKGGIRDMAKKAKKAAKKAAKKKK